jgi:hypothetical protein
MVVRRILEIDEAAEMAVELAVDLARRAYRLPGAGDRVAKPDP